MRRQFQPAETFTVTDKKRMQDNCMAFHITVMAQMHRSREMMVSMLINFAVKHCYS